MNPYRYLLRVWQANNGGYIEVDYGDDLDFLQFQGQELVNFGEEVMIDDLKRGMTYFLSLN